MAIRTLTLSFLTALTHVLTTLGPSAFGEELPTPTPAPVASEANHHSVQVDIRLVEISVTKLRELGFDWASSSSGDVGPAQGAVFGLPYGKQSDPGKINQFLDALRDNDLASILAEPRLVTLDGRAATIEINSEVATDRRIGKRLEEEDDGNASRRDHQIDRWKPLPSRAANGLDGYCSRPNRRRETAKAPHRHGVCD